MRTPVETTSAVSVEPSDRELCTLAGDLWQDLSAIRALVFRIDEYSPPRTDGVIPWSNDYGAALTFSEAALAKAERLVSALSNRL